MLNIPELEKQWSKYHFKKMLPRYIGSFIILFLVTIGGFFANKHKDEFLNKAPVLETQIASVKVSTPIDIPKKEIHEVFVQDILLPSYTFLTPLELEFINYNNAQKLALLAATQKRVEKKRKTKAKKIRKKKKVKKPAKKSKKTVIHPKAQKSVVASTPKDRKSIAVLAETSTAILINVDKEQVTKTESPSQAIIKVGNKKASENEIQSIIKRFNKKKKPALSLFISKKYYEMGNFEGAYKYADETYKLNSKIEAAVLLYAKSAVKLGKKEKALSRLDKYIKKNSSHKAKKLRDDIQKGTFQ